MARLLYGGSPADFTTDGGGRIVPNEPVTVWTARVDGTQVTDLLDIDFQPIDELRSGADGSVLFYGPNNTDATLWLDSGRGPRLLIRTVQITAPADSVTTSAIDDGAVTPAKMADAAADQVLIFNGTSWVARDTSEVITYADLAGGRVIDNA